MFGKTLFATLLTATWAASPLQIKVAASSNVQASERLLSAIEAEVTAYMAHEMHGAKAASFLKMLPGGYEIKHGMFTSQPLRSPVASNIHVVEAESPAQAAAARSIAQASADNYIRQNFEHGVLALR